MQLNTETCSDVRIPEQLQRFINTPEAGRGLQVCLASQPTPLAQLTHGCGAKTPRLGRNGSQNGAPGRRCARQRQCGRPWHGTRWPERPLSCWPECTNSGGNPGRRNELSNAVLVLCFPVAARVTTAAPDFWRSSVTPHLQSSSRLACMSLRKRELWSHTRVQPPHLSPAPVGLPTTPDLQSVQSSDTCRF